MIKTLELITPDSCLNRAQADEPIFVLLGRDVSAPRAVSAWVADRIHSHKNKPDDPQIVEARKLVRKMREFRAKREKAKKA